MYERICSDARQEVQQGESTAQSAAATQASHGFYTDIK
jgi:hypothetical protein